MIIESPVPKVVLVLMVAVNPLWITYVIGVPVPVVVQETLPQFALPLDGLVRTVAACKMNVLAIKAKIRMRLNVSFFIFCVCSSK